MRSCFVSMLAMCTHPKLMLVSYLCEYKAIYLPPILLTHTLKHFSSRSGTTYNTVHFKDECKSASSLSTLISSHAKLQHFVSFRQELKNEKKPKSRAFKERCVMIYTFLVNCLKTGDFLWTQVIKWAHFSGRRRNKPKLLSVQLIFKILQFSTHRRVSKSM
jgi:hypothetical protein